MFGVDAKGIQYALRFTVSLPFDGGDGRYVYPGSTWSGLILNVHLLDDGCKINITQP